VWSRIGLPFALSHSYAMHLSNHHLKSTSVHTIRFLPSSTTPSAASNSERSNYKPRMKHCTRTKQNRCVLYSQQSSPPTGPKSNSDSISQNAMPLSLPSVMLGVSSELCWPSEDRELAVLRSLWEVSLVLSWGTSTWDVGGKLIKRETRK